MSVETDIPELIDEVSRLVRAAYRRGFDAGSLAMRESIMKAVSAPMSVSMRGTIDVSPRVVGVVEEGDDAEKIAKAFSVPVEEARESLRRGTEILQRRAPRGLVAEFLHDQLREAPGQTIRELEEVVELFDSRIARKSVGNELRRFEDVKYGREGYKWFLMGNPKNETPAGQTASASEPRGLSEPLFDHTVPRHRTPESEVDPA